jgi:hypothetical protein
MKTIILLASLLSFTGCKKSGSCEDIYNHTKSLLPDAMKSAMDGKKDDAIAKCEKLSPQARQCALDATSLEDLMKCPKS